MSRERMKLAIVATVEPEVQPLGLKESLESNFAVASRLGYDGVELFLKDPSRTDVESIKRTSQKWGLIVPTIGTGASYTVYGLSLSSQNNAIREKAVKRIKEYLRIGKMLNSWIIIGSIRGMPKNRDLGMKNLKGSLMACAEDAEATGARMLIEPLNRYESNLINRLEEAIELKEEIGSSQLGVMADTYHMNIEEKTISGALEELGDQIDHIHFADSNRLAPGQGHIDFRKVVNALRRIGYDSFVTIEVLPLPDPCTAAKLAIEHVRTVS